MLYFLYSHFVVFKTCRGTRTNTIPHSKLQRRCHARRGGGGHTQRRPEFSQGKARGRGERHDKVKVRNHDAVILYSSRTKLQPTQGRFELLVETAGWTHQSLIYRGCWVHKMKVISTQVLCMYTLSACYLGDCRFDETCLLNSCRPTSAGPTTSQIHHLRLWQKTASLY